MREIRIKQGKALSLEFGFYMHATYFNVYYMYLTCPPVSSLHRFYNDPGSGIFVMGFQPS